MRKLTQQLLLQPATCQQIFDRFFFFFFGGTFHKHCPSSPRWLPQHDDQDLIPMPWYWKIEVCIHGIHLLYHDFNLNKTLRFLPYSLSLMAKALSKSSFCFWMLPRRSYALPRLERVVATSQWSGPNSRSCTTPYRRSCGWGRLQKTRTENHSMNQLAYQPNTALTRKLMSWQLAVWDRVQDSRCPVRCCFPISVQMYVSSFQLLRWRLNTSEIIKKRGSMTSLQSRHSESTCREWDMCPSWISRAFSKWSLSCAASPQRPYLVWLVGDQLVWSRQLRIEEISSTTYKVQEKVPASDLTIPDVTIIWFWGMMISQTGKA